MKESSPLLKREYKSTSPKRFDNQFKISLFALFYGCAMKMRDSTETQFIYAYLNAHTTNNLTIANEIINKSTLESEKCFDNTTITNNDFIQGLASNWTWYIQLVLYGIGLPVLLLLGPLSDRIGRKKLLIYNLLLTVISLGLRTYIIYSNSNLYWYLLFCGVEGLAGSHYVYHFACCAMLSDCTKTGKQRPFAFALYEAMLGVGTACSEIGTGYLIKLIGYTYPFIFSTGMMILVWLIIHCILTDLERKQTKNKDTNILSLLRELCTIYTNNQAIVSENRRQLLLYLFLFCLHHFPFSANATLRTLYVLGTPFCWNSVHIGWYGAGSYLIEYITSTFILKYALICLKDITIAVLGFISTVACFAIFGIANDDWMIYTGNSKQELNYSNASFRISS